MLIARSFTLDYSRRSPLFSGKGSNEQLRRCVGQQDHSLQAVGTFSSQWAGSWLAHTPRYAVFLYQISNKCSCLFWSVCRSSRMPAYLITAWAITSHTSLFCVALLRVTTLHSYTGIKPIKIHTNIQHFLSHLCWTAKAIISSLFFFLCSFLFLFYSTL